MVNANRLVAADVYAAGACLAGVELATGEVWSRRVSIPTVVTKMSLANGRLYTYSKPAGPRITDRWYFTTLDFRTGRVVYSQLAETGLLYNNNYTPVYLGPDGTVYVGVLGGFVAMRDATRQEPRPGPSMDRRA